MRSNDDPRRDPLPPPFPVGAHVRCIDGGQVFAPRVERARNIATHPEDWIQISGRGIEVTIDETRPGHRGTGRHLHDEDGPMYYEDDGEPIVDATRDGYSVYRVVRGDGHLAKNAGRCIHASDVDRWQVLPARLLVREGDLIREAGDTGVVIASGQKTFDAIWTDGSTTRYRHGVREVRLLSSIEVDEHTRDHLFKEAKAARAERRAGAGVRRGRASP